jgi:hypothetical protein
MSAARFSWAGSDAGLHDSGLRAVCLSERILKSSAIQSTEDAAPPPPPPDVRGGFDDLS